MIITIIRCITIAILHKISYAHYTPEFFPLGNFYGGVVLPPLQKEEGVPLMMGVGATKFSQKRCENRKPFPFAQKSVDFSSLEEEEEWEGITNFGGGGRIDEGANLEILARKPCHL